MDLSIALLSQLFDSLPLGIVVLDARGKVVIYNRAEEQLANRQRADVIGREFFVEVAPCMNVRQLAGEFTKSVMGLSFRPGRPGLMSRRARSASAASRLRAKRCSCSGGMLRPEAMNA